MSDSTSVDEARALLMRLRDAAPAATAARLTEVVALLESLAQENAYLTAMMAEDPPAATPPPPPEIRAGGESPPALDLLQGIDEALRAPLVAIMSRAEMIEDGLLGSLSDQQQAWLKAITGNTRRAFALLDSVQQIVALDRDALTVRVRPFVSADLAEAARDRADDALRAAGHRLALALPDPVPMAQGDFYLMLFILADLLDNAARYTPPGGRIRLTVESLGTHVLFSVIDNGVGLNPDDLAHIGQPFWRGVAQPLVRAHAGTGLRLYLARRVLALQGGELIFSGAPGVGSTFSFTLPAA